VTPRRRWCRRSSRSKRAEAAARRAQQPGAPAGSAAAGAAHHLRSRNDGSDRQLRRHRELFALPHRPPAPASRRRRCSNMCPTTRLCSPTKATSPFRRSAACSAATSGARRPCRIRLPPALLHGQPPAAFEEWDMMRPQSVAVSGDAERLGAERKRRRVRRAGDPPTG
jgi:hypothetical protein